MFAHVLRDSIEKPLRVGKDVRGVRRPELTDLLYDSKVAILGHLPAPDFGRNGRAIFALYQSCQAQGIALAELLKALLGDLFFCGDIGVYDMKPK